MTDQFRYAASWSSSEAEFSDRQVRKMLRALGWSVPWWRRLFRWIRGLFA